MAKEVIRVVAAVIEREGRYLITQRNAGAVLPLLWEFPGGRVEPEETAYDVHMMMFRCTLMPDAQPYPATVNDLRWVTSREFLDYDFPPADEKTMSKLLGLMRN